MENSNTAAKAMVDGVILAEAVSTIYRSSHCTTKVVPTLVDLIQKIVNEAQSGNNPEPNTFVSSFMNSLTASNPSLMKTVKPSRPALKEGAIASCACSLASGQGK
jgi:hypothetical protein